MAHSGIISSPKLLSCFSEGHPISPILGLLASSLIFTSPSPPVTMFCQLLNLRKIPFHRFSQNYSNSCPTGFPVPNLLYATETHVGSWLTWNKPEAIQNLVQGLSSSVFRYDYAPAHIKWFTVYHIFTLCNCKWGKRCSLSLRLSFPFVNLQNLPFKTQLK